MPEGPPVVIERGEPVADLVDAPAGVPESQRRPVREVTLGGRTVAGEVPQRQLGKCFVPVQPPACRHTVCEYRVRVGPREWATAADELVELEEGEQQHQ